MQIVIYYKKKFTHASHAYLTGSVIMRSKFDVLQAQVKPVCLAEFC